MGREVEWQVAMRPGKRRELDPESAEAMAEKHKASVRAKVEDPVPEGEADIWLLQGSLPGIGEEHGAAGAAFWTGQPADGGGSTDRLTWAQWAQTRTQAAGRAGQSPQGPRRSEPGGRNIRETGPGSRVYFRETPPVATRKAPPFLFRLSLAAGTDVSIDYAHSGV